jgi:TPP-dependent pyruvate/acetoin dehydrogenase alpha subunit
MTDNRLLTADEATRIGAEIAAEIDAAVAFAEAGTLERTEDLERFVLMDSVVQDAAR